MRMNLVGLVYVVRPVSFVQLFEYHRSHKYLAKAQEAKKEGRGVGHLICVRVCLVARF
jgi:hypothetical protein